MTRQRGDFLEPATTISTQADPLDDHWLDQFNQADRGQIKCGQEASARLSADRTWADWSQVGEALQIGRMGSMRAANRNSPRGRAYNEHFGRWLKHYEFDGIDKADRARLFECMDHLAAINEWRTRLSIAERLRFNHPATVLRHWKARERAAKSTKPKRASLSDLQKSIAELSEENERLKCPAERGGEPPIHQDDPDEIAHELLKLWSPQKAEKVARALLELVQEDRRAWEGHRQPAANEPE
jgi:hypothetical protein